MIKEIDDLTGGENTMTEDEKSCWEDEWEQYWDSWEQDLHGSGDWDDDYWYKIDDCSIK